MISTAIYLIKTTSGLLIIAISNYKTEFWTSPEVRPVLWRLPVLLSHWSIVAITLSNKNVWNTQPALGQLDELWSKSFLSLYWIQVSSNERVYTIVCYNDPCELDSWLVSRDCEPSSQIPVPSRCIPSTLAKDNLKTEVTLSLKKGVQFRNKYFILKC